MEREKKLAINASDQNLDKHHQNFLINFLSLNFEETKKKNKKKKTKKNENGKVISRNTLILYARSSGVFIFELSPL